MSASRPAAGAGTDGDRPRRPVITARLRLEPWRDGHADLLVRLSSLPEVVRNLGTGALWTRDAALALSARQVEHGFGWRAAADRATGELVGLMALSLTDGTTAGVPAGEHELGWWLDPAVWGRGLAREGAAAIRDEAFRRTARAGRTAVEESRGARI